MTLPNFLIVGAPRSGSTSLYEYLNLHPQIFMSPNKEPSFFAFEGETPNFAGPDMEYINQGIVTRLSDYEDLFHGAVGQHVALGEATPLYLYGPYAAERIHHHIPHAKIIAILRNPVDRAYSNYRQHLLAGHELLSFDQACARESERARANWSWYWRYLDMGFYYLQLKRYFDRFSASQIRVYLFDDLEASPITVVRDILRFLGVSDTVDLDVSIRYNASGVPKSRLLNSLVFDRNGIKEVLKLLLPGAFLRRLKARSMRTNLINEPLEPGVRQRLTDLFRDDLKKVETLIGRDLSMWYDLKKSNQSKP